MKIVIAIDSFKGSLSSVEAGCGAKEGILRVFPDAEIIVKPLADGGEGTVDALLEGLKGEKVQITVTGPMGKPVNAYYGFLPQSKTALIEMAAASGITLVEENEKNPLYATTYGLGEMIKDAINRGCRDFIIGIGGSATNDGGIGMLTALGYQFSDENGNAVGQGGQALAKTASISAENALRALKECNFKIACDVTNPLCGPNGATYVFGAQKGVREDMQEILDLGMENYAAVSKRFHKKSCMNYPGAGAAGGLGFAFMGYLEGSLLPGAELILNVIELEKDIRDCDYVITGEGMLDFQTAMGKVPIGVAQLAKKYGKKVIAFAGGVTKEAGECNKKGIDAFFSIVRGVSTLQEAMDLKNAKRNMADTAEQVFRLIAVQDSSCK